MNISIVEDFVISRTFDAPRALLFSVWTEPRHLQQWFSPKGFTVLKALLDLRPGGTYHYGMLTPQGTEMWGKWLIREIVAPEKLVWINTFSDPQGGLTRHPFSPQWPLHMMTTVTFDEQDGKTTVTIRWSPYQATEAECKEFDARRDSMKQGWGGTLDNLEAYVERIA